MFEEEKELADERLIRLAEKNFQKLQKQRNAKERSVTKNPETKNHTRKLYSKNKRE